MFTALSVKVCKAFGKLLLDRMGHRLRVICHKTFHNALGCPKWIAGIRQHWQSLHEKVFALGMVWTLRREKYSFIIECPTHPASLVQYYKLSIPNRERTNSALGWNEFQNELCHIRLNVFQHRWPSVAEGLTRSTVDSATPCQGQNRDFFLEQRADSWRTAISLLT